MSQKASRRLLLLLTALLLLAGTVALGVSYLRARGQYHLEASVTRAPTLAPPDLYAAPIDPMLRIGSAGLAVLRLQEALQALGYYSDDMDGEFGSATQQAVKLFQETHGLTADGIAGNDTLEKLYSPGAKPYASSPSPTLPQP